VFKEKITQFIANVQRFLRNWEYCFMVSCFKLC